MPKEKFSIIYADPPWRYEQKNRQGSAELHYPTMSIEEICSLPVVLLQRPRHLPKSGSQHFSRELRCSDRKGNRFLVYFFLHKTSFPSGAPLSGRPPYNLGEQKTSGQCGAVDKVRVHLF